jgi:hypothetical protein
MPLVQGMGGKTSKIRAWGVGFFSLRWPTRGTGSLMAWEMWNTSSRWTRRKRGARISITCGRLSGCRGGRSPANTSVPSPFRASVRRGLRDAQGIWHPISPIHGLTGATTGQHISVAHRGARLIEDKVPDLSDDAVVGVVERELGSARMQSRRTCRIGRSLGGSDQQRMFTAKRRLVNRRSHWRNSAMWKMRL